MKYVLPENHGLSALTQASLLFHEDDKPALSDAQFGALEAGVGRGESMLVVSPTSTGKTQIALWAIARGLEARCNTVYLVTHRALAKQKFTDFKTQLLDQYLDGNSASLVVATGDYIEDADGESPRDPLGAQLLVATYEKYLALLSASGIPSNMQATIVVCDEIQLLGDANRGQHVEMLPTLLRNAGWNQFVGLSAVLQPKDAQELSAWLGIALVIQHRREKQLRYECWTRRGIVASSTEHPDSLDEAQQLPANVDLDLVSILISILQEKTPPLPIIVFCMTKKDTYQLSALLFQKLHANKQTQMSLAFDGLPETSANEFLAKMLEHRIAAHNADLLDEERAIVETHLLAGKLDVVFATSTLAAGVNFPLGAAIFAGWTRWNFAIRQAVPIDTGEFHNMAGRVGRMGFGHEKGRVVFFADGSMNERAAREYLNLDTLPSLAPRVTPGHFDQLSLQLIASGLCSTRNQVAELVCTSFSALREQDKNLAAFMQWPDHLDVEINRLVETGLVVETHAGLLSATPVGKATGHSGLLPRTGVFLLNHITSKAARLADLLPTKEGAGDMDRLTLLLFAACLSSPEFRSQGELKGTRRLPFPTEKGYMFNADYLAADLPEPVWQADVAPIHCAKLSLDWIEGASIRDLEASMASLTAGMLLDLYRNLSWVLQGLASIISAAADSRVPPSSRPTILRSASHEFGALSKFPRVIRRLALRLAEGLPDDVLWMNSLNAGSSEYKITRGEILTLRKANFSTPTLLMLGSRDADAIRIAAFHKA